MNETIINDWALVFGSMDPYKAPEQRTMHLEGVVKNHPRRPDSNKRLKTSAIVGLEDGRIVTQAGTRYALGNVLPEYEALYPNALTRLLDTLKKKSK
jgi:hypothetical protein